MRIMVKTTLGAWLGLVAAIFTGAVVMTTLATLTGLFVDAACAPASPIAVQASEVVQYTKAIQACYDSALSVGQDAGRDAGLTFMTNCEKDGGL